MIRISANSRAAKARTNDPLTTGSVGIEVLFTLSNDWDGLARTAVFQCGSVSVDVLLTDDQCTVPPECLATAGQTLRIGIYGTNGQGTIVIPTVFADVGTVEVGTKPTGVDPAVVTPEFTDQLMTAVNTAVTVSREANANSEAAVERSNEALAEARTTLDAATAAKQAAEASAAEAEISETSAANSAEDAAQSADRAEQAAAEGGYMFFEIDDAGHLIYTKTSNVDVDFELVEGRLVLNA